MAACEIDYLAQLTEGMGQRSPLLQRIDQIHGPEFLAYLLFQEVHEVGLDLQSRHWDGAAAELSDVLVFACALAQVNGISDKVAGRDHLVNGVGSRSDAFDHLVELAGNLEPENIKSLQEVIAITWSIARHMPHGTIGAMRNFSATIEKVLSNRPPALYSDKDEQGAPLSDTECIQKYRFLEQCMRALRNHVGRTLQPSDWLPYQELLQTGWRYGPDVGYMVFIAALENRTTATGVHLLH